MEEGAIDVGGVGCRLDAFDLVIFDVGERVGKRGDRFWAVKVHAKVQFALSASRT
jgi:hypothetical protein